MAGVLTGLCLYMYSKYFLLGHDAILKSGLAGARKAGIIGKAVTPFLLEHFHTASEGESLSVNIEIIKSNSALAADIAVAKQQH